MKEKEYLLYQASILNSSYINHRFLDIEKIIFEAIPETTFNFNRVMEAFYNFKTNIDYEKFDKNFDNLLLNKPIDNWFSNLY